MVQFLRGRNGSGRATNYRQNMLLLYSLNIKTSIMRRLLVSLTLITVFITLNAQSAQPSISFKESEHVFGKINEQNGKVTYNFAFVNTGGSPLLIQNVSSSCGCTTPDWTKQPVPPGGSGFVSATYDPAGRPGAFHKYITVISNGEPASSRLVISGEVVPKPRTIEDDYRYEMGGLRLKTNHLSFGNIKNTEKKEVTIEVINNSDKTIEVDFELVPAFLSVKATPAKLAPGASGIIAAVYDAPKKNDWGFLIDRLNVKINGVSERDYRLVVSANIEEDFSALTPEQLAKAPVMEIDNPEFNFGTIKNGEKVEHEFVIRNSGKTDLIIRSVKASCGCTAVQPEKNVIAPGETTKMKVIFNSAGKTGSQNKTVTVITNDPKNSKAIFWVKGDVQQ